MRIHRAWRRAAAAAGRHARRLAAEGGSTLVELLVAIPAVLAVAGAAMALLGTLAGEEQTATRRTGAIAAQQIATDRITRDIRQASSATVLDGGARLQLSTYVFQNGAKRQATVVYDCTAGACRRIVSPATSASPMIDGILNSSTVFSVTGPRHVTVTLQLADGTVTDGAELVNAP